MPVTRTLKPGQPGTRRFQACWGDKLVAVRYRRSANTVYTTIEIIVDEREQPRPGVSLNAVHADRRAAMVAVRIAYEEHVLRNAAKRNHARWDKTHKVWLMPRGTAVALGLQDRVVEGLAEQCTESELW
ncbi:MAG: hypothetical protein KDI09_13360 [Halioglobus sp.]|nr:hypothetical protein [Halioglobus sp.]